MRDTTRVRCLRPALVSFNNLVEFYVLEGLRKVHHVNMSSIRRAIGYMRNNASSGHPLADYEIRTEGKYVWFFRDEQVVNASKGGQTAFDAIVTPYLRRVSRDPKGWAESIIPFKSMPILRLLFCEAEYIRDFSKWK